MAGHFRYVIKLGCVWEMACADGGCGRVDFDGGDGLGAGTFDLITTILGGGRDTFTDQ
jgi:hypothetical protein